MPVYLLRCPDCDHEFRGMVLKGTKPPELWVCSQCKSDRAIPADDVAPEKHPWDEAHRFGCPCCS